MSEIALTRRGGETAGLLLLGLVAAGLTLVVICSSLSLNIAFAIVAGLGVVTLWWINRPAGVIAAILFYLVKSFFMRLLFGFDFALGANQFDLLGMTPPLVMSVLILGNLYSEYAVGKAIAPDKPRKLALALAGLTLLSVFYPTNTIFLGLAGFQRNILPNLLVMFLTASVWQERVSRLALVKALLIVGIASCLYGVGQWFVGIYPWEESWMMNRFSTRGESGLLTIGLRGIEFRIYSIFFSYMDCFFTNVIIFALAVAYHKEMTGGWKALRIFYYLAWGALLILSVERMPMLMTLVVALGAGYFRKPKARRRILLRRYLVVGVGLYLAIFASAPVLEATGAQTLARLSELANPFAASSIQDRSNTKWGPTLAIIATHPWGVGTGYGSQTRASKDVETNDMYVQPHNELLQKVIETGIAGGIVYLLLLLSVFRIIVRRRRETDQLSRLAIALAGTTVAFWLCGMVNLPFSSASGLLYWGLVGILLAQQSGTPAEADEVPE